MVKHRTYEASVKKVDRRRQSNVSGRRGVYWWVGGNLKDSKGRIKEVLVRVNNEEEAHQTAYEKFEPFPDPDIFSTTVGDTVDANRIYRMRRAEKRDMLLGDTLARVRHKGKDISVD